MKTAAAVAAVAVVAAAAAARDWTAWLPGTALHKALAGDRLVHMGVWGQNIHVEAHPAEPCGTYTVIPTDGFYKESCQHFPESVP